MRWDARGKGGRPELYRALREAVQAMEIGDPPLAWDVGERNIKSVRTLLRDWSYDAPRRVYRTYKHGPDVLVFVRLT